MTIPTALTDVETGTLQTLAANKTVLEIGSLFGHSTIAMARVAKKVWAVDPHKRYPHPLSPSTLWGFINALEREGVRDKIVPILARAQEVLPSLRGAFDLIFIDVSSDAKELIFLANALDPSLIVLHDYDRDAWPQVRAAVEALFQIRSMPLQVVQTLAILNVSASRDLFYEDSFPSSKSRDTVSSESARSAEQ